MKRYALILIGLFLILFNVKSSPPNKTKEVIITNTVTIIVTNEFTTTNAVCINSFPLLQNTNGTTLSISFYETNSTGDVINATNTILQLEPNNWIDLGIFPCK